MVYSMSDSAVPILQSRDWLQCAIGTGNGCSVQLGLEMVAVCNWDWKWLQGAIGTGNGELL